MFIPYFIIAFFVFVVSCSAGDGLPSVKRNPVNAILACFLMGLFWPITLLWALGWKLMGIKK
jgi:hypothetical protein